MNIRSKIIFLIIVYVLLTFGSPSSVLAEDNNDVTIPSFPRCESPQGELIVTYGTGIHGIPGHSTAFIGSDTVYNLSDTTLSQCFCASSAKGVQTNWWKVSSLTIDEIEELQKLGWIYVPDGSLWGLEEAPYMAKNRPYTCIEQKTDDGHDHDHDHDDDEDEDEGDILGVSVGGPFRLAQTGNIRTISLLVAVGLASLAVLAVLAVKQREQK